MVVLLAVGNAQLIAACCGHRTVQCHGRAFQCSLAVTWSHWSPFSYLPFLWHLPSMKPVFTCHMWVRSWSRPSSSWLISFTILQILYVVIGSKLPPILWPNNILLCVWHTFSIHPASQPARQPASQPGRHPTTHPSIHLSIALRLTVFLALMAVATISREMKMQIKCF